MKKAVTTEDIRDIMGRIAARYSSTKGVIEIKRGKYIVQIIIPPETPIEVLSSEEPSAK